MTTGNNNNDGTPTNQNSSRKEDVKNQETLNNLTNAEVLALEKKIKLLKEQRGLVGEIKDQTLDQQQVTLDQNKLLAETAKMLGDSLEYHKANAEAIEAEIELAIRKKEIKEDDVNAMREALKIAK